VGLALVRAAADRLPTARALATGERPPDEGEVVAVVGVNDGVSEEVGEALNGLKPVKGDSDAGEEKGDPNGEPGVGDGEALGEGEKRGVASVVVGVATSALAGSLAAAGVKVNDGRKKGDDVSVVSNVETAGLSQQTVKPNGAATCASSATVASASASAFVSTSSPSDWSGVTSQRFSRFSSPDASAAAAAGGSRSAVTGVVVVSVVVVVELLFPSRRGPRPLREVGRPPPASASIKARNDGDCGSVWPSCRFVGCGASVANVNGLPCARRRIGQTHHRHHRHHYHRGDAYEDVLIVVEHVNLVRVGGLLDGVVHEVHLCDASPPTRRTWLGVRPVR
jgi:hypothetical protein